MMHHAGLLSNITACGKNKNSVGWTNSVRDPSLITCEGCRKALGMSSLESESICHHKWQTYLKRENGHKLYLDFMKCTKCERVLEVEYLVRILGYVLDHNTLSKIEEAIHAEDNRNGA